MYVVDSDEALKKVPLFGSAVNVVQVPLVAGNPMVPTNDIFCPAQTAWSTPALAVAPVLTLKVSVSLVAGQGPDPSGSTEVRVTVIGPVYPAFKDRVFKGLIV